MEIKELLVQDYEEAIKLKIRCWDEELNNHAPNRLVFEKEYTFFDEWTKTALEHNDIRIINGAYDGDKLIGYAAASIAEEQGYNKAVELNYLFVNEKYRGQGISIKLMESVLKGFAELEYKNLIVYNLHYSPSNNYYKKLGGVVVRQDIQGQIDRLEVDIFAFDLQNLLENLRKKI